MPLIMKHYSLMKLVRDLLSLLLCTVITEGVIYWNVSERVSDYGQTARLFCFIGNDIKPVVGYWDRYVSYEDYPVLTFAVTRNESGRSDTKYSGQFIRNGFSLEIRNLSREDLNTSYECSVDSIKSPPKVLFGADVFKGSLNLVILQKVEKYGETFKLLCLTDSCNNRTCHWKYGWNRYVNDHKIQIEDLRGQYIRNISKYYSQLVFKGFTLEIRNVNITDLDSAYECYLPFNKSESLSITETNVFNDPSTTVSGRSRLVTVAEIIGIVIGGCTVTIIVAAMIVVLKRNHVYSSVPRDVEIATNPITGHNNGETRYARQSMVVHDVFSEIVRDLAEMYFKPKVMQSMLEGSPLTRILAKDEIQQIKSMTNFGYAKCDFDFLIKALTYFNCLETTNYGFYTPLDSNSQTLSDDIGRMKSARKALFARPDVNVEEEKYERFLSTFYAVGQRLGTFIKKTPDSYYKEAIENIKTRTLEYRDVRKYTEMARNVEQIKLYETAVFEDIQLNLCTGQSLKTAVNDMNWEEYEERKIDLILYVQNSDTENRLFRSIMSLQEQINEKSLHTCILNIYRGCIVITMNIHPFALQSEKAFTSEILKTLLFIVERSNIGKNINIDVVAVEMSESTGDDPKMSLFSDENNEYSREQVIQDDCNDLILTTMGDVRIQSSQSYLCQGVRSLISDVAISARRFTPNIDVVVSQCIGESRRIAQSPVIYNLPITVHKTQIYDVKRESHEDCVIVNNTIVLTDNLKRQLSIIERQDGQIRHIPLSEEPWGVTAIDCTTLAVSFSICDKIQMIDIQTGEVKDTILTRGEWWYSLTYYKGHLYGITNNDIIYVIDLHGNLLRKLPASKNITQITVDQERIFYTVSDTLYCCDLFGKMIWNFRDVEVIKGLRGVTVDSKGNVYVVGQFTKNVVVVSFDSKQYREIIDSEALEGISVDICLDKATNELVVCSLNGEIHVFKIEN